MRNSALSSRSRVVIISGPICEIHVYYSTLFTAWVNQGICMCIDMLIHCVWIIPFVISNSSHVGYPGGYRLQLIKVDIPLVGEEFLMSFACPYTLHVTIPHTMLEYPIA